MLILFFSRIWGLGITSTDDASWFLAARQGHKAIVSDFAFSQGRIWAFVSGSLLYGSLFLQNTQVGEIVRHGPMALFFILFHVLAARYLGYRTAVLAALMNLSLFAVRWEGSLAVTYPGVFWPLGCCFIVATLAGLRFRSTGNRNWLRASAALLFLSLFVHEGATALFSVLFPLMAIAPVHGGTPATVTEDDRARARRLLIAGLATAAAYAAIYLAWRLAFPTRYDGNSLGRSDISLIPEVMFRLASSGTLVSGFFAPMSVNFNDAVSQDGFKVVYAPLNLMQHAASNPIAWLCAATAAAASYAVLRPCGTAGGAMQRMSARMAVTGLLAGAMIAALPVLPVAAVEKYQRHFYELHITSYVFTVLSHFGIALAVASVLSWLADCAGRVFRPMASALAMAIAAVTGLAAYCSTQMNDMIVRDMRPEAARWKVVDRTMAMDAVAGLRLEALYAPRLASGSWFGVVDTGYWQRYISAAHKRPIHVIDGVLSPGTGAARTAFMDFSLQRDGRQLAVVLAPLTFETGQRLTAQQIALFIDKPDDSDMYQYVLSFQDLEGGQVVRRFADLAPLDDHGHTRILRSISAVPASIRLERHSAMAALPLACDRRRIAGLTVAFGNSLSRAQGECLGSAFLMKGWHLAERSGSWTRDSNATLQLPTGGLPPGQLEVDLKLASYVGLGFGEGTQEVTLLLGDRVLATRTESKGSGPQSLKGVIPASAWSRDSYLPLTLRVNKTVKPGAGDARDLGLYLYEARLSAPR
ncbi:MAG: hypothetical protein V4757_04215 [Pseudomonadota bacterium]